MPRNVQGVGGAAGIASGLIAFFRLRQSRTVFGFDPDHPVLKNACMAHSKAIQAGHHRFQRFHAG